MTSNSVIINTENSFLLFDIAFCASVSIAIGCVFVLTDQDWLYSLSRVESEYAIIPKTDIVPMGDVEETKCLVISPIYFTFI